MQSLPNRRQILLPFFKIPNPDFSFVIRCFVETRYSTSVKLEPDAFLGNINCICARVCVHSCSIMSTTGI